LFEKVISLKVLWAPINKGDFTGIREKIEKKEFVGTYKQRGFHRNKRKN